MLENQQSVSEERHAPGFSYLVGWLLGWNSTNEVQIRVFGCHDTDRIEVSEQTQRLLNTMLLFPSTIVKKQQVLLFTDEAQTALFKDPVRIAL